MKRIRQLVLFITAIFILLPVIPIKAKPAPKLNRTTVNMSTVDTVNLKVLNTDKKVIWASSNKKIAKVNNKGKVTPRWFGTATISAKVDNITLKCTINILTEDVWSLYDDNYGSRYQVSIMPISKNKARVRLIVYDNDISYLSGDLFGKYDEEGGLVFIDQGKYHISGALIVTEHNNEERCVLLIERSDLDIFLTDGLVFYSKTENT